MQLREWLEEPDKGRSVRQLALAAKTTRKTIMRIRDRKRVPLAATAKRIEEATNGAVTAAELLGVNATEAA